MSDGDGVRTIDTGVPPARFARGWHCLGLASSFRDPGPHAVQAFLQTGQALGQSGALLFRPAADDLGQRLLARVRDRVEHGPAAVGQAEQ